jgi:hypothetical protein
VSSRSPLKVTVPKIRALYIALIQFPGNLAQIGTTLYGSYNPELAKAIGSLGPNAPIDVNYIESQSENAAIDAIVSDARRKFSDCDALFQPATLSMQGYGRVQCVFATYVQAEGRSPRTVTGDMILTPASGSDSSSMCFVATACYGSNLAPQVQTLREFRDERLLTTSTGRRMIRIYNLAGPSLARVLDTSPPLRAIVRGMVLRPILWFVRKYYARPIAANSGEA